MLGFSARGGGGALVEAVETRLGGRIPINTSGSLRAKGHPIGATGCSMITELVEQLRGEAGPRQVEGARLALAENDGGVTGFDEAVAVITILEGNSGAWRLRSLHRQNQKYVPFPAIDRLLWDRSGLRIGVGAGPIMEERYGTSAVFGRADHRQAA